MKRARKKLPIGRAAAVGALLAAAFVTACGWSPSRPFEREAPPVREAIAHLDGGDAQSAAALLAEYLTTGPCAEGNIGTPRRLHERPNASFDMGLALFRVAEAFGHRFGDEEAASRGGLSGMPPVGPGEGEKGASAGFVECAMKIVRAIADDALQPLELRARAYYLQGNLLFLDGKYKEAVEAYDKALELVPGTSDLGPSGVRDAGVTWTVDALGRDAAWNRAIALRREEDKKDASPPDGGQGDGGKNDPNQDGGGGGDGGSKGDGGKNDGRDGGGKNDPDKDKDKEQDAGGSPPPKGQDAGGPPPPPSRASQDERILDGLEAAPTVQQEYAKKQRDAQPRRARASGMADK